MAPVAIVVTRSANLHSPKFYDSPSFIFALIGLVLALVVFCGVVTWLYRRALHMRYDQPDVEAVAEHKVTCVRVSDSSKTASLGQPSNSGVPKPLILPLMRDVGSLQSKSSALLRYLPRLISGMSCQVSTRLIPPN